MAPRGVRWAWWSSVGSSFRSSSPFTSRRPFTCHSKSSRRKSWIALAFSARRELVLARQSTRMPWKASFRMTDHWHDFRPEADPSLAPRPAQARALRSRSLGMTAGRVGLRYAATLLALSILFFTGCTVGPKYARPSSPVAPAYHELTPENFKDTDAWKHAQPSDATLKGTWWEIFNDPQLNALKEQLNVSNQNIAAAAPNFMAAPALVRPPPPQYYPTTLANPPITNSRPSLGQF